MAELMFPNLAAAIQQGVQFGTNQRKLREGEQREATLRDLASRAYAAPSQERQPLIQQAIATDPEAGFALGGQLDKREADQAARAGNVAIQLLQAFEGGNPAQIQGVYNAVKPYFQSIAPPGTVIPDVVDDTIKPMLYQLKAAAAGDNSAANAVQSTQILANGNIGIVTRDGRVVDTGQRSSPSTQVISQPGQVPFLVTTGRGQVGETTNIGGPQIGVSGQPYMIDPSLPPQVQEDIRRMESGQPTIGLGGPAPVRTPTAAENAFAEARARNQAELDAYQRQTGLAAEREAATTTAREQAQAQTQKAQILPQVIAAADETVNLLDRVLTHPGREAATGLSSANPLNRVPGTAAYDFNVLLDQIKGQAFLQAFQSLRGGGAITEREGQAATNAIARLNAAQSEEEFVSAVKDLKRIVSAGRDRAISSSGQTGQYRVGQVIESGGKRYRVTDVSDPNDPDVEEVR